MLKNLFIYEKKISPVNNKIDKIIDIKILKFNKNKSELDKKKDTVVPDQVLFGLILGNIRGPPKYLPKIYAMVSLKKEIKKIKKNIFLSMLFMKKSII